MQAADPHPTVQGASATTDLMSFLCPCCHHRLNVSSGLAGIAGPCPVCAKVIRAPQPAPAVPIVNPYTQVTTSEIVLPDLEPLPLPQARPQSLAPSVNAVGDSGIGFRRIAPVPTDGLDDSWRDRHERERKQSRKRHRRDQLIANLFESPRAKRMQKVGLTVISVVLAVTMLALYVNHRTGGVFLRNIFGR